VHFHRAGAERANPVLRKAVEHDVADVEIGFEPRRVELVDVAGELDWAQQELVPDLLDCDNHLQLARERQQALANHPLGSRPRVPIRGRLIDDCGYEQHGVRTPECGIAQGRLHAGDASIDDVAIAARQREAPVIGVHHGVNAQAAVACGVLDLRRFVFAQDRLHLDRVEPRLARGREALRVGKFLCEHRDEDGLLPARRAL
jgi:hypothetical protein